VRIYDQVRARPLYLVDRTVNVEPDSQAEVSESSGEAADLEQSELLVSVSEINAALAPAEPPPSQAIHTPFVVTAFMRSEADSE